MAFIVILIVYGQEKKKMAYFTYRFKKTFTYFCKDNFQVKVKVAQMTSFT